MRALELTWKRIGFEDPAAVERLLVRGTLTGALTFLAGVGIVGWQRTQNLEVGAVAFAAAGLLLAVPRQRLGMLLMLVASITMLPLFFSWTPATVPFYFTVPLGLVLALEQKKPLRRIIAAVGPSLGGAWCLQITHWLSSRHLGGATALHWLAMSAAGLFVSAGAALAWVRFDVDSMVPQLASQPKAQLAWLRLRTALRKLPRGTGREQLEVLAHEGAERLLDTHAQRAQLAAALDEAAEQDAREAVDALQARLKETADAELESHLRQLLRVHQDTLEQVDELHRKVERLDARAAAEAGWLETAAFSVELAPKREPAVSELTSRLRALSA